jgi:hypothetical protein
VQGTLEVGGRKAEALPETVAPESFPYGDFN